MGMFDLSTKGFRQVFADRSVSRMVEELVSNAFDEDVTRVDVHFEHLGGQDYRLKVTDDSQQGFEDLRDSYTVFGPSKKKSDPTKRGRFCFGEKWVIARCQEAVITSMTGRVIFDVVNDRRIRSPKTIELGTEVECRLRTTREEYAKACDRLMRILVPERITLTLNGEVLPCRPPVRKTEATLPTEYADENGDLRRTERKCQIDIYEVLAGEVASIYELGIPIVETGDVFHYDVRQRVPLPINRNNVSPAYLRRLRGAVLDRTADLLTPEQAANKGITDGISTAKPATRVAVMTTRFGEKRYVTDFNREAGGELFAEGHTPVPPNTFDTETWDALKAAGAIRSANQLRPKHYVAAIPLPEERIIPTMQKFRQFAELLCRLTLNKSIATWTWSDNPGVANVASCGPSGHDAIDMAVNVGALGAEWFSDQPATCARNIDLLIHELGHHSGALDCTREHADEMTRIKGQLAAAKAARSIKDAEIDTKLQIARQKAEMIRKRQECKRPEVLAVLSPLTTPGYWLPKSRMPSEEKQPLSLSTIRSSGALARGREGLYALWLLGADKHDTLRPRWPYQGNFGHSVNTPESYEHLKRVQTYLIDYGDALVAEGCLSP